MENEKIVLREDAVRRALVRIAHEIAEKNPQPEPPALVGIHRRGAFLAQRLQSLLGSFSDSFAPATAAQQQEAITLHALSLDRLIAVAAFRARLASQGQSRRMP